MTTLISPAGERVEVLWVQPFCRERGLDDRNLRKVIEGSRQHHKGWRCADIPAGSFDRKPYAIERYLTEDGAA